VDWIHPSSALVTIHVIAGEFKLLPVVTCIFQLMLDLLPAAAVYAVLGLPYPVFGVAVTQEHAAAYACRAYKV